MYTAQILKQQRMTFHIDNDNTYPTDKPCTSISKGISPVSFNMFFFWKVDRIKIVVKQSLPKSMDHMTSNSLLFNLPKLWESEASIRYN